MHPTCAETLAVSSSSSGDWMTDWRRKTLTVCACCTHVSSCRRPSWPWKTFSSYVMLSVLVWITMCLDKAYGSIQEVDRPPARYPDKHFNEVNVVFGRKVTCLTTSNDLGNVFPSETWSCYNIRVDDLPVRSCYSHAIGLHSKCENEDGRNDFGAICRQLLKLHNVRGDLKAALIVPDLHVSSGAGGGTAAGRQKRMILSTNGTTFVWHESTEMSGRLKDLRCMLSN